jgi:ATP-dependent DNA helicase RecQ
LSEKFWQRAERLTELRRAEQRQMQEYVSLKSGHMDFLISALDGDPCNTQTPDLPLLPIATDAALVRQAIDFLRRTSLPFEPRKQWPSGGMALYGLSGRIPPEHQARSGRALCVWGDAGWGRLVREGKYHDGRFMDDLVTACESLVRQWNPQPAPTWVTCVPSLRHPDLVPDFAQRVGDRMGLPFHAVLKKTDNRPEQKTMANSAQQARNIDGSLTITKHPILSGSVLLIDDMVDSRWTMTVAAWLLRTNGSGEVFPLVLALTGQV